MSIPLSTQHGLNPVVLTCPICGEHTNGLAVAGNSTIWKCDKCGQNHVTYVGKAGRMHCVCGNKAGYGGTGFTKVDKFDGNKHKILDSQPCDACLKNETEMAKVVADGGVYWKCSTCGSNGAVKKSEFSASVREVAEVEAPNPVGIDFEGGPNCPICNP